VSRIFPSLQSKLIAAFVAVTVVSLAVSAAVFVRLSQSDQRQRAIEAAQGLCVVFAVVVAQRLVAPGDGVFTEQLQR
jgi:CHASE3 domain sensor protein